MAGCGGDGDRGDQPSADDPATDSAPQAQETFDPGVDVCALGIDRISAYLDPDGEGDVTSGPGDTLFGPSCVWKEPSGTQVVVRVSSYDDFTTAEAMGFGNVQPLTGLGEEAWLYTGIGGGVAWRRDDVSVHMELTGPQEALVDLAWAVEADLWASRRI